MSDQKIRIAINGFGRIGRTLLRILTAPNGPKDFEVVAINDIEPLPTCAYLFQYDSVFGVFHGSVETSDNALILDGQAIPFFDVPDISRLDLAGVDLVLECTGMVDTSEIAQRGLQAGAKGILISGPSDVADATLVIGANERKLGDHSVISNASCTTNALAPLMKILDAEFGLISGHMTTVHCYTGSQPTIDKPRGNPERSRAAALSIVPTTTSAQRLVDLVLPELKGRVEGRAIRVPTASVSAIDLTLQTEKTATVEAANSALKRAVEATHILGWITQPLVSSDLRARPQSLILSERETSVSVGGLLRVFGWYDNEWGFSSRMLDMARLMAARY
jgi:glyceraldehyde 3-phosphate dehydrogenase (phosphorylating)